MILVYTHDGETEKYNFVPGKLLSPEAEAIEDVGGQTWASFDEFGEKFLKGNRKAFRAALWIMKRRAQPTLRFADITFAVDEVTIELDNDESRAIVDEIRNRKDLDELEKAEQLRELELAGFDITGTPEEGKEAPESSETHRNSHTAESGTTTDG